MIRKTAILIGISGLLAGSQACRAPRDFDLERRSAEARAKLESRSPAPSEPAAGPKAGKSAAPAPRAPAPVSELRSYTQADTERYLKAIPGTGEHLVARLQTAKGEIRCTLDIDNAPQTVTNLVALATAQISWHDPDTREKLRTRFYDGQIFHRVIEDFIIQTGNPGLKGAGGPGWTIPREEGTPNAFAQAGVLAMVDDGDDSHGSQFFITLRPAAHLAGSYTPFGRCEDLDVAREISRGEKLPPARGKRSATKPVSPILLKRLVIERAP